MCCAEDYREGTPELSSRWQVVRIFGGPADEVRSPVSCSANVVLGSRQQAKTNSWQLGEKNATKWRGHNRVFLSFRLPSQSAV